MSYWDFNLFRFFTPKYISLNIFVYPPASEARRGVYWNQAQKNFTHQSVTLWLRRSVAYVVYFDQLSDAARIWKLVIYFICRFQPFVDFIYILLIFHPKTSVSNRWQKTIGGSKIQTAVFLILSHWRWLIDHRDPPFLWAKFTFYGLSSSIDHFKNIVRITASK